MKKQQKNSPPFSTASWSKKLLRGFGFFRIRRFRVCLIFWKALQLVKKQPHTLQPIRIQVPDLPDDLVSVHLFPFPLRILCNFLRASIIAKEATL